MPATTKMLIPPDLADDDFLKRGKSVSPECFLHSLREKRRLHWQSARNNGDNAIQRMSEMYSDAGHFVYELLQNAEDAEAHTMFFRLADNALTVMHDGKPFSRGDIVSITAAGTSTKDKANAIGKFGVGFKSVFAVCDRPEIYSGEFCFAIESYIIPQPLSSPAAYAAGDKTVIHLPLKEDGGNGLREKIKQTLDGLGAAALLFLRNIRRLEWQFDDGEKHSCQKSGKLQKCDNNISAGAIELHGENPETYFLLSRREEIGGKPVYVKVAYKMLYEGEIFPMTPPPLSVYFPLTKEKPDLRFHLHIPYKTTPDRETCDFDDAENETLTKSAAAFVADTLPILRDKQKLSARVVNDVMPWRTNESHTVYHAIAKTVKDKFLSDKLLPVACGNYATAQEVIATDGYMPDITKAGFTGRDLWLVGIDDNVRTALKIPFYGIGEFLHYADEEVLSQLTDEQMVIFYHKLQIYYKQKTQWTSGRRRTQYNIHANDITKQVERSRMRSRPIVRLQEPHGEKWHIAATEEVRFPKDDGDSVFPTVARVFLEDEGALYFLREVLGIKEPDDIDEVGEIVKNKNYAAGVVAKKAHIADMRKILQVAAAEADKVVGKVAGKPVVKTASGVPAFAAFDNSFLECEDLRRVFDGYSGAHFVDESFYDGAFGDAEFTSSGGWRGLFGKLGVRDDFVITVPGSMKELEYALQGIKNSGDSGDFDRSVALWRFMIRSANRHSKDDRMRLREKFMMFSWLYDENQNRISAEKVGEYALENIHPQYRKEAESASADIAALSETVGLRFDDAEEWKRQAEQSKDEAKQAKDELRDAKAQLAEARAEIALLKGMRADKEDGIVCPKKIMISDYQPAPKVRKSNAIGGGGNSGGGDAAESKAKGRVGEAALCEWLRQQYPDAEVVNENDGGKNNPGYDILVVRDGITEYYECKSFVAATPPRRVSMTRAQMEMAEREGKRYFLCVIYDIDSETTVKMLPPIPNPAALDKSAAEWSVDISGQETPPD